MRITNPQKKELNDIFRKMGLNVLDFEASGQYKEFKVKFKYEYFSFSINYSKAPDTYSLTVLPVNSTESKTYTATWATTKKLFASWVAEIATELTTPTGWETFENAYFLNDDYKELAKKFNESEKIKTRQSLLELKEKINSLEIPKESLRIINKKLDDLNTKVEKLTKFDWKSLFIGCIANLIMTFVIPPEATGMIWEYIKTAFGGLRLKA